MRSRHTLADLIRGIPVSDPPTATMPAWQLPNACGIFSVMSRFPLHTTRFFICYNRAYVTRWLHINSGKFSTRKSNWSRCVNPRRQSTLILALEQCTSPWQTLLVHRNNCEDEIRPLNISWKHLPIPLARSQGLSDHTDHIYLLLLRRARVQDAIYENNTRTARYKHTYKCDVTT